MGLEDTRELFKWRARKRLLTTSASTYIARVGVPVGESWNTVNRDIFPLTYITRSIGSYVETTRVYSSRIYRREEFKQSILSGENDDRRFVYIYDARAKQ